MSAFVPRLTRNLSVLLVVWVILGLLSACATPAAAVTPTTAPPTDTSPPPEPSPTEPATAVSEATPTTAPASPTATERPATNTPRPTQTTAPTNTPAATHTEAPATAAATHTPAATGGDLAPTQAQVWNTAVVGGDNQTGSCSATANAPYGLVALTPGEGGILAMRNTVPEDYVLARLGPNTYQYAGPSALGDGNLTLDVVFTSATTLEMTRTFQPSAEPGCTHQHRYTGTFRNNR